MVLFWISKLPEHWQVYVANRVTEIQCKLMNIHWSYVNTADLPFRGLSAKSLINYTLWLFGPAFFRDYGV